MWRLFGPGTLCILLFLVRETQAGKTTTVESIYVHVYGAKQATNAFLVANYRLPVDRSVFLSFRDCCYRAVILLQLIHILCMSIGKEWILKVHEGFHAVRDLLYIVWRKHGMRLFSVLNFGSATSYLNCVIVIFLLKFC